MTNYRKEVTICVNGRWLSAIDGQNLLEVITLNGIDLPAACSRMSKNPKIRCRLCLVEIEGTNELQTACSKTASNGMVVRSNTQEIERIRKENLQQLFANSHSEETCAECIWDGDCEFYHLAQRYGIRI